MKTSCSCLPAGHYLSTGHTKLGWEYSVDQKQNMQPVSIPGQCKCELLPVAACKSLATYSLITAKDSTVYTPPLPEKKNILVLSQCDCKAQPSLWAPRTLNNASSARLHCALAHIQPAMLSKYVIARSTSYSGEVLTCQTVRSRDANLCTATKNERTDTAAN